MRAASALGAVAARASTAAEPLPEMRFLGFSTSSIGAACSPALLAPKMMGDIGEATARWRHLEAAHAAAAKSTQPATTPPAAAAAVEAKGGGGAAAAVVGDGDALDGGSAASELGEDKCPGAADAVKDGAIGNCDAVPVGESERDAVRDWDGVAEGDAVGDGDG